MLIGQRMRDRRRLLGFSMHRVAEGLGISYQQIQKYEAGKDRVPASSVYLLSVILRVPVDYFFSRTLADVVRETDPGLDPRGIGDAILFAEKMRGHEDTAVGQALYSLVEELNQRV